ncbi:MAG TPA: PEP-CTERM sorting domain-containing protein [Candidatus Sulfotelmatobacter sp.]|jgi:hypothetical protein|nr:PEP-CTERM sorting domain-containing protein [Candidatus Sulfotelmatobacter sp.]
MRTMIRSLFLFALLLAIPVVHADGAPAATLQGPKGPNDFIVYNSTSHGLMEISQGSHGLDNLMDTKPASHFGGSAVQTHDDTSWLATRPVPQPHTNWLASGSGNRESIPTAPEPSMLLMLVTGLLGVGFFTLRKVGERPLNRNLA